VHVIFVAVFAVMFYSIWKHRKSVGHKAASFHESVTVEIVWTIIPFIIVILMALPATKVIVAMKDTTNADITIKATGMQWKWGYDYLKGEGEGIGFLSALDPSSTARCPMRRPQGGRGGRQLPAQGGQRAGGAGRQEGPHHHHRHRRDPCLHGAGIRHQAGRHSRFRARHLVPRREDRRLLRPVRRAVRQGARLHADPREGAVGTGLLQMGRWREEEDGGQGGRPDKVWTVEEITKRGEKVYAANCAACHQPNGKGAGPIKPLDGSAIVLDADKSKQIAILLNGANNGAMPAWKTLSDTDIAAVITYTKNNWSNKTGQLVQPADVTVRAQVGAAL
jgi:cytochrome c oxidase subunit 2